MNGNPNPELKDDRRFCDKIYLYPQSLIYFVKKFNVNIGRS